MLDPLFASQLIIILSIYTKWLFYNLKFNRNEEYQAGLDEKNCLLREEYSIIIGVTKDIKREGKVLPQTKLQGEVVGG